ncbi:MAG: flagellar basal body-associated protein FliL [Pseudomonadota bacterium]|nr:flagellar basal body-associated protein FliL [Pseudomonadota bacterium]
MAKITAAPAPTPASADPTPIKKKGSKLPMLIGIAVLILMAAGGAAWHFLHAPANAASPAEAKPAGKPLFVTLEPFTVNLAEESGDHYLQVGIVYQVDDDKVADNMKLHMPIVRNRLLLLLSAKHPSDLTSADGKRKLVDELVLAARESLPGSTPEKGVSSALLGSFVIQ